MVIVSGGTLDIGAAGRLGSGNYAQALSIAGAATFEMGMVVDGLTAALLCVVTLVATLVFLYSTAYMKGDPRYHRFLFWLSFFGVSKLLLTLADNLLMLFIGWELVGLCSYKLIGFWSEDLANAEAANKAFITTRAGDVGMLIGLMILYAQCGTLHIGELFAKVQQGAFGGQETMGVYRANPQINAVLHSHGAYTVAATLDGADYLPPDFEGRYYFERVPVLDIPYADYWTEAPRRVPEALRGSPIVVVRGHGVYAAGDTLERAYKWTCSLELSAKTAGDRPSGRDAIARSAHFSAVM